MFRTGRIESERCNPRSWQPVEKYSRVENFPNGAEPVVELENRCTGNRTGGSNPSPSASFAFYSSMALTYVFKILVPECPMICATKSGDTPAGSTGRQPMTRSQILRMSGPSLQDGCCHPSSLFSCKARSLARACLASGSFLSFVAKFVWFPWRINGQVARVPADLFIHIKLFVQQLF